jgi:hypothetical protein
MDSVLKWFGILVTSLYMLGLGGYVVSDWYEFSKLTPNEWGDFLAGSFSPLAFLWLVLGFFQQGKELRQNNEALKLQAAELKNSVEQQKELVRVTTRQVEVEIESAELAREQRRHAIKPHFVFASNGGKHRGDHHKLDFSFSNLGGGVTKVNFSFAGIFSTAKRMIELVDNGEVVSFSVELDWAGEGIAENLNINYIDKDGGAGVSSFSIAIIKPGDLPAVSAEEIFR